MRLKIKRILSVMLIVLFILTDFGGTLFKNPEAVVSASDCATNDNAEYEETSETSGSLSHVKATSADFVVPNAYNMKGVQGTEITTGSNPASLSDMGVNHILLNVDLNGIISTSNSGTVYNYNGKKYYFNESEGSTIKVLQQRVKEYREQGVVMTFVIQLSWSNDPVLQKLMYNPTPGKIYYALNVVDASAREQIAATLHYMANRFGYSDTFVQNWRMGNEVNISHDYYYTGAGIDKFPLKDTLINIAYNNYDLLYDALSDENPYARCYVSVTHDWNYNNEGKGVSTKDFIDGFAEKVSDPKWNIDFHAYPPQMAVQVWTKECGTYLSHNVNSPSVCAANLEVLTDYIKTNYGTNHRIAMSEQSYDSTYGEAEQAAMIAYTYYAAVKSGMVDNVIYTTWQDTNSVYHDFYNMGVIDIYGKKKLSYNVFKYMNSRNSSLLNQYVNTYLTNLSTWTGRKINSWNDDILYKAPSTSIKLTSASLYMPSDQQGSNYVYIGLTTTPKKSEVDIEYQWSVFNYVTSETTILTGWNLNNEWIKWYPEENSSYQIKCTARIAGNTSSMMSDTKELGISYSGLPTSVATSQFETVGVFATYNGYSFYRDASGNVTCYDSNHKYVKNGFMCDGTYTYYFQANGTAMRNRLTYHPDGVHIIYFDQYGHEVFDNFANVKTSISGASVDDMCYFNTYGYMYVDFLTYDVTGTKQYYANPYGVMERNGWFRFSDGGLGYANADGTLMFSTFTYDQWGRTVYLQSNGHAAVGLITDGVYYYLMDDSDGHLIGMF